VLNGAVELVCAITRGMGMGIEGTLIPLDGAWLHGDLLSVPYAKLPALSSEEALSLFRELEDLPYMLSMIDWEGSSRSTRPGRLRIRRRTARRALWRRSLACRGPSLGRILRSHGSQTYVSRAFDRQCTINPLPKKSF
jgi:hypothetical protein